MTDQPAEAAFNERWQVEADVPLSDRPVAVMSVGLGDSRTSTTLSIAAAASEENRKVLLIDKTPLIGYIHLRPRGLGVRTLWERLRRSARRGAGTPTVGPRREQWS